VSGFSTYSKTVMALERVDARSYIPEPKRRDVSGRVRKKNNRPSMQTDGG
jgi:hypothetical protein